MNKRVALIAFVCCSVFATLIACSSSKNATVNSDGVAVNSEKTIALLVIYCN